MVCLMLAWTRSILSQKYLNASLTICKVSSWQGQFTVRAWLTYCVYTAVQVYTKTCLVLVERSYCGQLMSRQVDKSSVESSCNLYLFRKASVNANQSRSKNVTNGLLNLQEESCAFCQASDAFWKCDKFIKDSIENH